jgi:hypothetical protein
MRESGTDTDDKDWHAHLQANGRKIAVGQEHDTCRVEYRYGHHNHNNHDERVTIQHADDGMPTSRCGRSR